MENRPQYPSNQPINLPNGTTVLVLGIISIVGCLCYGLPGLICGIIALVLSGKDVRLYQQNPGMYSANSYSNLRTGRVCAIIGLVLSALYALAVIVVLIMFGAGIFANPQEFLRNMH